MRKIVWVGALVFILFPMHGEAARRRSSRFSGRTFFQMPALRFRRFVVRPTAPTDTPVPVVPVAPPLPAPVPASNGYATAPPTLVASRGLGGGLGSHRLGVPLTNVSPSPVSSPTSSVRPSSAVPCITDGLAESLIVSYPRNGFGTPPPNPFLRPESGIQEIQRFDRSYSNDRSANLLAGTKDHVYGVEFEQNSDRLTLSRDGQRATFDLGEFIPSRDPLVAHPLRTPVRDITKVYGKIDPATGARTPVALEILYWDYERPLPTGIPAIDRDRLLKANNQIYKSDGDQAKEIYTGSVIVRLDGTSACPVAAVQRRATDARAIALTGGREYRFRIAPNTFPPHPQGDRFQQKAQAAADLHIRNILENIENYDCASIIPSEIAKASRQNAPGFSDSCIFR